MKGSGKKAQKGSARRHQQAKDQEDASAEPGPMAVVIRFPTLAIQILRALRRESPAQLERIKRAVLPAREDPKS